MLTNNDFNVDDLFDPYQHREHLHLAAHDIHHDGTEVVVLDAADVVTCKRCGALVLDTCTDDHLRWHHRIEATGGAGA
jgi:hypothetical protein